MFDQNGGSWCCAGNKKPSPSSICDASHQDKKDFQFLKRSSFTIIKTKRILTSKKENTFTSQQRGFSISRRKGIKKLFAFLWTSVHLRQVWNSARLTKQLREGWRYQIGWIFRKISNGLRPPPHFRKIILQFFFGKRPKKAPHKV